MRVLLVLLTLSALPFAASAAQGQQRSGDHDGGRGYGRWGERGRGHDEAHCAMRVAKHKDRDINKCDVDAEEPPPPPPPPPPPAGTSGFAGWVYEQVPSGRVGLSGWTVTVSGAASASTVTDAAGNWAFTGLASGDYTLCVVVPSGFSQTSPTSGASCPGSSYGYAYTLPDGMTFSFIWFGNLGQ